MKVDPILYAGLPDRERIMVQTGRRSDDPENIIEAVCDHLNVDRGEMMSPSRKKEYSEARCIAIGLILQVKPDYGLKKLGQVFGGRDHSTILYNRTTFDNLYERDKPFTKKVQEVLKYV